MPKTNLVRPSRDGDQFHYLWAARRCLALLSADTGLVAISIEGPSPSEASGGPPVDAGEELIDIAEYFGSEDIGRASLVRYMQLKHSTLHDDDHWTASGLEKTISGFASRYEKLGKAHAKTDLANKLEFWFVTNRRISADFLETIADAADEAGPRHPGELKKLERFTKLARKDLAAFCKLLRFEDKEDGYWDQRSILFQDVSGYLPDADVDAPTQLKELVTRRALSEGEQNPTITKIDVLRALKTDESQLLPAPCLIADVSDPVPREQEPEIIDQIITAKGPVIVHASGGVGKTIFAARIGKVLPQGSVSILYDCFGNGQYRSVTGYRHRHKDALVQIANELAARSFCHPLIPTTKADAAAYVQAFVYRLGQAVKMLRLSSPDALLCIIVDAADNAQMAALEIGEARSFARDLVRSQIPDGVRVVFLCRSHRQDLLDPPIDAVPIQLLPFSRNETAAFLRQKFPSATDHDIDEFHRLSSQNPRVQSLALSRGLPLEETLRLLGPNPTSVEDAIAGLLENAIAKLKDTFGPVEKERVERICAGLAALRPLIPIPVLSAMAKVPAEAIKSFAYDIGRPLLVAGDTIQFLDEPAETWFREKFKPTVEGMGAFLTSLRPIASSSAYVAATLPQLMLEAGQFSELVDLALSSAALPESSPLERRDVELQRLQFALKAGLRSQRYLASAKLALKAGGETAGDERQRTLLQENTDLAAEFLELDLIQEIVSRRTFGSGWVGSHHAYEAALLSGRPELVGDARSRLRMAHEWLQNLSRLPPEERKEERITDQDIVEMTYAHLNIHGPASGAASLRGWTPREVSFRVGRKVIRRLIDHGRLSDIDEIALAARSGLCLVLAVIIELCEIQKTPPNDITKWAFRYLTNRRVKLAVRDSWNENESVLDAVTAVAEAALTNDLCTRKQAADLLSRYLPAEPPRGLASRFSKGRTPLLRAYCLRAALQDRSVDLLDVAYPELKAEIEKKKQHSTSRELQEFQEDVGAVLPWHNLWASVLVGKVQKEDVAAEIKNTASASSRAAEIRYRDDFRTSDEIASLWMNILHRSSTADTTTVASFDEWKGKLKRALFTPTLNSLCRLCAQHEATKAAALAYAAEAYKLTKDERSNAESKAEGYIEVARSIFTTSKDDAKAYFNEAIEVAGKIGDENLARWEAITDLADCASRVDRPAPVTAYQFARCAELTYDYVVRDKHFDWNSTVSALCGLCPSSAIAILSRWRDRGFGWHERLLPIVIENLIDRELVDPRDALPLIGFRAQWEYDRLLASALTKCESPKERALLSAFLYRYARFSVLVLSDLRKLKEAADAGGAVLQDLAETIAFAEREEASKDASNRCDEPPYGTEDRPHRNWNKIFANKDLTVPSDVLQAYLAFKDTDTPWYHEEFFAEAIRIVPAGSEAKFVQAIANVPGFDLYHLRHLLEKIPESWKSRPAISVAMSNALKVFCRRHCMTITRSRYYQILPLDLACSLAGVTQGEIADVVLAAIGESPDLIETNRLFSLVALIALKLFPDEALEALTYGLDLFNPVLEDKDGDGPWQETLLPPQDIRCSIAGYIWAGLAAPEAVARWEAAHAVLALCHLARCNVLACLMGLAATRSGGPFIDVRLPFYGLHALQWLLIGLARAALDAPDVLAPYGQQLVDCALKDQPHVLIRKLAALAAFQLIDSGNLADVDGLKDRLTGINESQLNIVDSKRYERNAARKKNKPSHSDDEFYFSHDIGSDWYDPLGRVFALSQWDIEAEATQVIRHDLASRSKGGWNEDERGRRNLYEEGHTYHSHSSYPRADNLNFYNSYHAMMIVAGRLLATTPTHRDAEYGEEDEFAEWLSRHDLTRDDGRWLWDRRDPMLLERGAWLDRAKDHVDRKVITSGDFDEALRSGECLNLWGYWTEADSGRVQSTHVHSALVSPERSESLVRALGTAKSIHDYSIPSADDDFEIDESGFVLKG